MNLEDILRKNKRLKNLHAGKRCFIIGNGPSTNNQNLELLKDDISIAVNDFTRHPKAKIHQSDYWVLADPAYWEHPQEYFIPVAQLAVDLSICPILFAPTDGFKYFSGIHMGPLIDMHFYHYENVPIDTEIDFSKGIPPFGQNIINIALMLAFNLGCNPIYIIGVDMDLLTLDEAAYNTYKVKHSYVTPSSQSSMTSNKLIPMSWEQWLVAKSKMIFQFGELKAYASKWGFDVFDATRGGHLNVFPKVEFETLFTNASSEGKIAPVNVELYSPKVLAEAAIRLLDEGSTIPALKLLEDAAAININGQGRVSGLQYLRAMALARLFRFKEALLAAREDYSCNPQNRHLSEPLIRQLEEKTEISVLYHYND